MKKNPGPPTGHIPCYQALTPKLLHSLTPFAMPLIARPSLSLYLSPLPENVFLLHMLFTLTNKANTLQVACGPKHKKTKELQVRMDYKMLYVTF